jgi:hypothetical protein
MYFLQQYKTLFLSQLASYQEAPEWVREVETPEWEPQQGNIDAVELWNRADMVENITRQTADGLQKDLDHLRSGEAPTEIPKMTTQEVLETMEVPDWEKAAAERTLWEGASNEAVMQQVFDSRVEALNSSTITSWEAEIIEAEFIGEVAQEAGINPELIWDLRALWFQWAQDWAEWDVAANLQDMTNQLQVMKTQIEANGWEFPQTKEEFLALYEAMNQNDAGETNNNEMDPAAAAANGVDAIRDSNGGFQIAPTSEGYRQVGDSVVWPPGAPYSRGGQVYTGTGEISNTVRANLDTSYSWLQQNPWNPMPAEHASNLQDPENIAHLEKVVPVEWHWAAVKLANKEWKLNPEFPIMIASMEEKRWIVCYPDGRVDDFPIIVWSGWFREWAHSGWNTTPTYEVFNMNMNTKVTDVWVDASNSGSSTVLWASIQSPQWADSGWKWWHWVADSRIPGWATAWCIGWNQTSMMMAASAVLSSWGGYGFNVNEKTG